MNETDLTRAFGSAVAAGSPPLALDAAGMLRRARRVRRRRRIWLATATSALGVGAVAGALALIPQAGGGGETQSGGRPTCVPGPTGAVIPNGGATARPSSPPLPTPASAGAILLLPCPTHDTQRPWPSGQSDRTAHAGPHADRAHRVLTALLASLPAGYQKTDARPQAQFDHWEGDAEVWEYTASVDLTRAGGRGAVLVRVLSPSIQGSTDLCTLAGYFYGTPAEGCHLVSVNGRRVAVARHPTGERSVGYSPSLDQWAVYRAANGTVTWVAQARSADRSGPGLPALPFTETQLARLATRPELTGQ